MFRLILLLAVFGIGIVAYFLLREDGIVDQVTEQRVERALLDNGVPVAMAGCMAPRLVDRLSLPQLLKLERLAPQEGEARLPASTGDAMRRLRRVDDRDAIEQVLRVSGRCGLEIGVDIFGA